MSTAIDETLVVAIGPIASRCARRLIARARIAVMTGLVGDPPSPPTGSAVATGRGFRFCPRCATPLTPGEHGGRTRFGCPVPDCGFVHWDNPTPVVAAIVEHDDDHVILVRSHGWPAKLFGLVTGFLERDETPEDGVVREVREELGLASEVIGPAGVFPFFVRFAARRNIARAFIREELDARKTVGRHYNAVRAAHREVLGHNRRADLESGARVTVREPRPLSVG